MSRLHNIFVFSDRVFTMVRLPVAAVYNTDWPLSPRTTTEIGCPQLPRKSASERAPRSLETPGRITGNRHTGPERAETTVDGNSLWKDDFGVSPRWRRASAMA